MNNWLYWRVPDRKRNHYIFVMIMMMFVVPRFLLGIHFTTLGHFVNFIIYDVLYYLFYQVEKKLKGWRDDE
jgi:hypothetical protein